MSYEEFQEKVPLRTYEDLAPHIDRMKEGEADVLWPGTCQIYSVTSGTSTGRSRHIPVTEPMLTHFKQCGLDSLLWYSSRVGHAGVFRGRHLFLGASTALSPIPESEPFEAYSGNLSGIEALNLPALGREAVLRARRRDRPDGRLALEDRGHHGAHLPCRHLAPRRDPRLDPPPGRVAPLGLARGKARAQHLQGIWPNFECYTHSGVPSRPSRTSCASILGPTVNFHEVYPSSEAFIAAQDADSASGLRLMATRDLLRVPPHEGIRRGAPAAPRPEGSPALGGRGRRRLRARPHGPFGPRALRPRATSCASSRRSRRGSRTSAGQSSS
jgi:hypothetical protein